MLAGRDPFSVVLEEDEALDWVEAASEGTEPVNRSNIE